MSEFTLIKWALAIGMLGSTLFFLFMLALVAWVIWRVVATAINRE